MIAWGTGINAAEALRWVKEILGRNSKQHTRLAALLEGTPPPEAEQGRSAPTAFAYTTACADATQKHTVRVLG
jgi:hypothetical protein